MCAHVAAAAQTLTQPAKTPHVTTPKTKPINTRPTHHDHATTKNKKDVGAAYQVYIQVRGGVVACLYVVHLIFFFSSLRATCLRPTHHAHTTHTTHATHTQHNTQKTQQPFYQLVETSISHRTGRPVPAVARAALRAVIVGVTLIVALCVPFFGALMGIIGAVGVTPTTFLLPPLLWILYTKPPRWSRSWLVNWVLVFLTGAIGVLGFIGAFYGEVASGEGAPRGESREARRLDKKAHPSEPCLNAPKLHTLRTRACRDHQRMEEVQACVLNEKMF